METDVCIIGAGIVGLATAYQLGEQQPGLRIALVEKESSVAQPESGPHSGVIHSGIYYRPGSLRALNCRRGYELLLPFCEQHDIPYEICGKVIVATSEAERPALDKILSHGQANGLEGIRRISREETLEIEPHVNAVESIWAPQAGIVDYKDVAHKYEELILSKGQNILLGHRVEDIQVNNDEVVVITGQQEIKARLVISCAGLYADHVAKMSGAELKAKILPFRGEYYELAEDKQQLVNNLIYPVPNPHFPFLGVHYTRMIKGGIEAGPNAVLAFSREGYSRWDVHWKELAEIFGYSGFRKLAFKYWRQGLDELYRSYSKRAFVRALQHLIPEVGINDLKRGGAGVRAMACGPDGELIDDFLILEQKRVINVCNAPSPAATSSLAIGETIAQKALVHIEDYIKPVKK